MTHRGTETDFELTTIERLDQLGYEYQLGLEIDRPKHEVVLKDRLRKSLARRYPDLPKNALDEAVSQICRPDGVDTIRRNLDFHKRLTRGFELRVDLPDGTHEYRHIYPISWDEPEDNEFLVVNQFPVRGKNDRRPDIVIFINGLPLVLFELKNPYAEDPTVEDAHNQISHYKHGISQIFDYNAFTVISDGITTFHGMWSADMEWFSPWKSIDGHNVEANTTGSMKTLIEGLFPKDRLLCYIRNFIVFEEENEKITKKGARYHQYFAVNIAAQKAIQTVTEGKDRRIGVIWHTTGSGKSLSMLFLIGILRRAPELENPTFVLQVDRTDLDDQLHDQFVAGKSLVGIVKHAESVDDLREMLKTEGGEIIFSTIEKFRLKDDGSEIEHPVLSTRSNIIVIADEAHRSQYGFMQGYARYLNEALPNAKRLGFTGTPISFSGADTIEVFGNLIHTYDIKQSQEDKATVPIFYMPRLIKLQLSKHDIDEALSEITSGQDVDNLERKKGQWAALAAAAGAKSRMAELAQDLLVHFKERTDTLRGKAIAVCMTRQNCVRLYNALTALPGCPEVKIVMTGDLSKDPPEWSEDGHITTKPQREKIKQRMIDPDDPLQIAIVCDMWLTGTNIPCLHTLYIDKPMKGHTIIQAISRVNRVFSDKPHGLIVDYIGIGDELREATGTYTEGGGRGEPAPEVTEHAIPVFMDCREEILQYLPDGINYGDWRKLTHIEIEDRYALVYGVLTEDDSIRDNFIQSEKKLSDAFLLVKHLDECRIYADEIIFYQQVRKQLLKTIPGTRPKPDIEKAVRDLVDESLTSEGVVDIFKSAGIPQADISILDDDFLQTFKDKPFPNLRLKLLEKLLRDQIYACMKNNLVKAKSFRELLENTLQKYHNRIIDAAAVIKVILQIHNEIEQSNQRAAELGLEEDELAFYDTISALGVIVYDTALMRDLVHEIVQTLKRNLKVDWTEPHRDDVKASVRSAVKRVLRKRNISAEQIDTVLDAVMAQAEALFAGWPVAA